MAECVFVSVPVIDSEECEEAYGELLSLYDAERQQNIPPQTDPAGVRMPRFNTAYSPLHAFALIYAKHECNSHTCTVGVTGFLLSSDAADDRRQPDSPSARLRKMGTEELSTSFSTAGVTEEAETRSRAVQR